MMNRRTFLEQGFTSAALLLAHPLLAGNPPGNVISPRTLRVAVSVEEDIYRFVPAKNGAGPMWANGMTAVVRLGDTVFVSGLETVPEIQGLSNCRWLLFKRYDTGWKLEARDLVNLNREPCPLGVLNDQRILMSVNPKQADTCTEYCLTHPEILSFDAGNLQLPYDRLLPGWKTNPGFMDHSYRAMGVDRRNQELILFQNYMYAHAEWSFMNRDGNWNAAGALQWPTAVYNGKTVPLRLCYSNAAIRNKKVYFFSTADIVEPNEAWKTYKKQLTGNNWDYVFRRLFFTWSDDISQGTFHPWIELANYDATAGYVRNQDLWVDDSGKVHLLWIEQTIDERLRDRFFPEAKQRRSLMYAVIEDGKKTVQSALMVCTEAEKACLYPTGNARFHALPDGRLLVMYYVEGVNASGQRVSENRLMEVHANGTGGHPVVLPFKHPFISFQTANQRAGCVPDNRLDVMGVREGKDQVISYAQVVIG